jgi:DDE superfamily endonuclease
MLLGAGLERAWHHSRAHRFFAAARWSADRIGLLLADLIIRLLLPEDAPITLVVDDTLFKRAGKKVFGAFWHHDGAAKGPKPIGYGNCWVVTGIVVDLPFLSRPVCLPVLARLWTPKGTGKIAYAHAMAERLATRYPDRALHVVGDAAYISEHLRELSENTTWTSRLTITSVLHEPPPPPTGKVGRPKTKGPRLGTPGDLAKTATWHKTQVRRYGRTDTVRLAEIPCIWYGVLHTQTVRVILVCDDKPRTKDKDDRGYGLPLITTDLKSTAEDMIARYASRWSIEPVFFNARRILGVGEARNRLRNAVERTVPLGLITYTLVILRYTHSGHDPQQITDDRARRRWYTTKTEPSFEDMVIKLRRVIIAAHFPTQAPTSRNPKKPAPSCWPGPQPKHDHLELRNTRDPVGRRDLSHRNRMNCPISSTPEACVCPGQQP